MIKYKKVNPSNKMLELTKSNKIKKQNPDRNKKYFDIKSLPIVKFISSIIHKLNYFDFFIIFVIGIVVIFLLYNRFQRKSEWINVRISVENLDWWYQGTPPRYWYASDLKKGDVAKNSFGKNIAEVIKIDNYDIGGPYRNIYIDLKLKVVFDKNRDQYLYEYKPLAVGTSVIFNFPNQQIRGLIIGIGNKKIDYSYRTIKLQKKSFQNITSAVTTTNSVTSSVANKPITPEIANKISVGDKSYDNNNELIAEVLALKREPSSYYEFSDIRGQNIKIFNPYYRDLEVTLKVKTYEDLGLEFFINQAPIKIGSQIWIQFAEYSLEDYEIIEIIN